MTTRLTVEKSGQGTLLCTLEFLGMGNGQSMRFTMETPQNLDRTLSQLEYEVLTNAHRLLGEIRNQHPNHKQT